MIVEYSQWTMQYFIYNLLAKTHHHSRDVVIGEGKLYTAPNAADEAILNEDIYRDVIKQPNRTEKQSTVRQTVESLDNESPAESPKPKERS